MVHVIVSAPDLCTTRESSALAFNAVCRSVWSERVPVILPQVPPALSSTHSVSKSLLVLLASFWLAVPQRGTHTPVLPGGQVSICFS